ncbi:NAD(P)/FAD-dependent oxidoreductase [Pararhizobium arenae]|uniref:NAD(P)/FAD-dependent oxidoreductase n=1 Tax=Pararhizobium arenae TaxID=1856850 RepID=UPI00094AC092|nr:FAD-binding oxidoreductase [Pararhizobium arenae]
MTDVLIVGGGIMGLWAAVKAVRAGLFVHLVERERIGAGASGGLVGALMPHMPDRWNPKKQFQFEALASLEAEIAPLEAETGLSAGYRRSGRIMPLGKPHLRTIALRHEQEAVTNWHQSGSTFLWNVQDSPDVIGWPAAEACEHGVVLDTLAARVFPRSFLNLLKTWLERQHDIIVEEGTGVDRLELGCGRATLSDGRVITFDHCILANGVDLFKTTDCVTTSGLATPPLGVPVKGQAALLDAGIDPALPVVFQDGLYIIPHEGGRVAIGSTSEDKFDEPLSTDAQLDVLIERARAFAPCLRDAPVIQRWAGLRPKAIGRDPIAGRHPDHKSLHLLGGGFKISFGIAHRLAEAVIDRISGKAAALPPSFELAHHFALRR